MHISRIKISNFRIFENMDLKLNKVQKIPEDS
jgi:predicted ATP-dependent endonuclease of OLD family